MRAEAEVGHWLMSLLVVQSRVDLMRVRGASQEIPNHSYLLAIDEAYRGDLYDAAFEHTSGTGTTICTVGKLQRQPGGYENRLGSLTSAHSDEERGANVAFQ